MIIPNLLSKRPLKFLFFLFQISLMSCSSNLKKQTDSRDNWILPESTQKPNTPIIIAHRGASGYLPEHTIAAYLKAMEMGADFIEPDLVITKDGVLIARHENDISETTNVALVYPNKKTTKKIDGKKITGWFTEDFTLVELKKLKAIQRLPFRPQNHNLDFNIPTLTEVIDLVDNFNLKNNKKVGIYPEIKHSTYFKSQGFDMENKLINLLKEKQWDLKTNQIYIQSFEVTNLKYIKSKTNYKLIQLFDDPEESPFDLKDKNIKYKDLATLEGLRTIKSYAVGIGPSKNWLVSSKSSSKSSTKTSTNPIEISSGKIIEKNQQWEPSDLFKFTKILELETHPYTFRNEPQYIIKGFSDPIAEYQFFFRMGVTGVFSDFTDTAMDARAQTK